MILQAPYPKHEYVLHLPNPSLNNIRRLTMDMILKRNLSNEIITYVKRNQDKQFNWQFILSLAKMWELHYFLQEYAEQQILVVDHKDDVLLGYFINGSHTFTHERRGDFPTGIHVNEEDGDVISEEITSITLDFVGRYQ